TRTPSARKRPDSVRPLRVWRSRKSFISGDVGTLDPWSESCPFAGPFDAQGSVPRSTELVYDFVHERGAEVGRRPGARGWNGGGWVRSADLDPAGGAAR